MLQNNEILNETYQICREIGRGGSGVVYMAYHIRLCKYVVIKKIRDDYRGNFSVRTEADTLKNLHHPNLPQVYDFYQKNGTVYTVIDYVEGTTLAQFIEQGQSASEKQLRKWFHQLTEVLVYLHGQRVPIYHCDIKPANIIITPDEDAVLIDFNIAVDSGMLDIGGYSALYASPEQIQIANYQRGGFYPPLKLDGRTDIYSLAASFYHLISGKTPNPYEQPQPLAQMNLACEESFLSLLDRCMLLDREQRPPSAKRLLVEVERMGRTDSRYRLFFTAKCVSILLSALLISFGLYGIIHGVRQGKQEQYIAVYTSVFTELDAGNDAEAEQLCYRLLNSMEYQGYLAENPDDYGKLRYALGEIDYRNGAKLMAAAHYEQALRCFLQTGNREMQCLCYRDIAISYAEIGELSRAKETLAQAKAASFDGMQIQLAQTVLDAYCGDTAQCIEHAQELIASTSDQELCARACIAAATSCTDPAQEIVWLRLAESYKGGRTVLRGLGVAYVKVAQSDSSMENEALQSALLCFQELAALPYATKNDRLNYASVLILSKQAQQAVRVLQDLLTEYPRDYRALMNMAFAYNALGDSSQTSSYCRQALEAWKQDTSTGREAETSENIQRLLSLAEQFGIQG